MKIQTMNRPFLLALSSSGFWWWDSYAPTEEQAGFASSCLGLHPAMQEGPWPQPDKDPHCSGLWLKPHIHLLPVPMGTANLAMLGLPVFVIWPGAKMWSGLCCSVWSQGCTTTMSLVCNSLTAALWSNCHGVQVAFSASIVPCFTGCAPK